MHALLNGRAVVNGLVNGRLGRGALINGRANQSPGFPDPFYLAPSEAVVDRAGMAVRLRNGNLVQLRDPFDRR